MTLIDRVDHIDRRLRCNQCDELVAPVFSESGKHIRADCPDCGRYIKFVRQILPDDERKHWDNLRASQP